MNTPDPDTPAATEVIDPEALSRAYQARFGVDVRRFFSGPVEYRQDPDSDLCFFTPAKEGDEAFYRDLSRRLRWYYQETKIEFETAARYTRGRRVLDVGCGEGRFAATAEAGEYIGLEPNSDAARRGRSRGLDIRNDTLESFSAAHPGALDAVCLFQVAEHIADPVSFLRLAKNCLKPGGKLIVSVPANDSFVGQATNDILNMPPHHLSRWPDSAFGKLAGLLDLELERIVHEPLEKVHRRWYVSIRVMRAMERALGMESRVFDFSYTRRFLGLLSMLVGGLAAPLVRTGSDRINGHTVTAIFSKP